MLTNTVFGSLLAAFAAGALYAVFLRARYERRKKPDPIREPNRIVGRYLIEHQVSKIEPYALYELGTLLACNRNNSNPVFWCATAVDANALANALTGLGGTPGRF